MSRHRFFVPPDSIVENRVSMGPELVHRLRNVLRLGPGDSIVLLDGSGLEYTVRLDSLRRHEGEGTVLGRSPCPNEPNLRIVLYQALLKGDSLELVLQKCTELGIYAFAPLISERCVARRPSANRLQRWSSIVLEAAQQSRRAVLPPIQEAVSFTEGCSMAPHPAFILWEGETATSLKRALSAAAIREAGEVGLFVGPEGGFTLEEIERATASGIVPVTMGNRILRAETAGLIAATAVLYEAGDLGH